MIKSNSLKYQLYLLSFSFLFSCSQNNYSPDNWTHFFDPCIEGGVHSITGSIHVLKQKQRNDCWFVCYAMLRSWKDNQKYTYPEVLGKINNWDEQVKRNVGLYVSEQEQFFKDMNLGFYPPANYTYEGFVEFLNLHGPLIVCMGGNINHARILYKIECGSLKSNTYFYLVNPDRGKFEKWNAYKFFESFESEAKVTVENHEKLSDEEKLTNPQMKEAWRNQIIYIKTP